MGIFDFVSTIQETSETHPKRDFKTRYYRCGFVKAKEAVITYATKYKYNLKNINDAHGEIYLQTNKFHMMVSIIQINPIETAIDVKVQTYRTLGFHKPSKLILEIYQELNNMLTYKGAGLHP